MGVSLNAPNKGSPHVGSNYLLAESTGILKVCDFVAKGSDVRCDTYPNVVLVNNADRCGYITSCHSRLVKIMQK